ncbi:MAG: hypothetical protein O7A09_02630 [Proteobacteria bacterium]|nr:hypothetical protein [Pseudomonadota bacterium]
MSRGARGQGLVLAVCHELGNLLAAIRLHAAAVIDDPEPAELARVSVEVDDLAGRCGALLAQVRALLSEAEADPDSDAGPPASPEAVVAAVADVIEAQGLRGVRFSMDAGEALPPVPIASGLMHFLLLTQISGAADAARPRGSVRLSATGTGDGKGGEVRFVVEDDGPADAELEAWRDVALRGRALACALASHILEARGGALEAVRVGTVTRVELRLPAATGRPPV